MAESLEERHFEKKAGLQHACALVFLIALVVVVSASAGGWRIVFSAGTPAGKCLNATKIHPEGNDKFDEVCLGGGTERPFTGLYDYDPDEIPADGVYRCACCGEPLYPVSTQFKSGTGWPSFWAPVDGAVMYSKDVGQLLAIELSCSTCGAHLGHVFDDGVGKTGHRHCINSVCLDHDPSAHFEPTSDAPWVPNSYVVFALVFCGVGSLVTLCCCLCWCAQDACAKPEEAPPQLADQQAP